MTLGHGTRETQWLWSHIRRGGKSRRNWHIRSITRTCHENRWETTKLGCKHLDKAKPEALVNGKNTVRVRTGNGLSQNGYGCSFANPSRQVSLHSMNPELNSLLQDSQALRWARTRRCWRPIESLRDSVSRFCNHALIFSSLFSFLYQPLRHGLRPVNLTEMATRKP